jgi:hypothetical protein
MNAHWNVHEGNMKGKSKDMNTNERKMKGHKCKMKATSILARVKPTKQLVDRFPSLFRNGICFMLDLEYADL